MTQTAPAFHARDQAGGGPCLYYLHPLLAGPLAGWPAHFARAAALGFTDVLVAPPFRPARHGSLLLAATHDALHEALGWTGAADDGIAEMARMARAAGLGLLLDLVPERVANDSPLTRLAGGPFTVPDTTLDPCRFDPDGDAAHARLDAESLFVLAAFWSGRLVRWAGLGVAGFRLTGLRVVPPALVR